jgi:hypothetical protein
MSYAGPVSRRKRAASTSSDAAQVAGHLGDADPSDSSMDDESDDQGAASGSAKAFRPLPRYSTKGDRTAVFATGVVLGLMIGAGAALLLAPQSGVDTRNALVRRSRRLSKRGRNSWDDLRWELRQFRRDLQRKSLSRRAASSL